MGFSHLEGVFIGEGGSHVNKSLILNGQSHCYCDIDLQSTEFYDLSNFIREREVCVCDSFRYLINQFDVFKSFRYFQPGSVYELTLL